MSQERTRFPIQPKDVRRSAESNKDVSVPGGGGHGGGRGSSDKPLLPPHRRHEADAGKAFDGAGKPDPDAETADAEGADADADAAGA